MSNRFKRQRAKALNPTPAAAAAAAAASSSAFGDEDDYLSASFVVEEPNKPRGKRAQQTPDPEMGRVLSKKDIAKKMEDRREEGLQQKIGEENAGFKLLMKLGYKGGGLGKDGAGTTKPVMPELKQGRAGLGKETESKRRKEEQKELAQQKAAHDARQEVQRREHFRLSKAAQFVDRRLLQDLNRARRLVESLDEPAGRTRSIMWPDEPESLEDAAAGGDPYSSGGGGGSGSGSYHPNEGRADGGGEPSSAAASTAVVPAAYQEAGSSSEDWTAGADGGLRDEWELMITDEKLSACLAYLRASHAYCMYCACQYNGSRDLQDSCPGPSRDEHDEEEL